MRYSYTSGYEHFKMAQWTYIQSGTKQRVLFHLKMWGLTLIGLILLTASWHHLDPSDNSPVFTLAFIFGCGAIGGGLVGALLWPWQRRRSYRIWNGEDDILNLYLEVDGPFLITGRPGRAESRFERAAVCKVVEDDQLVLLFLNKRKFVYLPKNIGVSAIAELYAWLSLPGAGKDAH